MDQSRDKQETLIMVLKFVLSSEEVTGNLDSGTEELCHWYEDLLSELKKDNHLQFKANRGHKIHLVPQLFALLKECLLTHRWKDCLEVMSGIARETSSTFVTGTTVFRVGAELFYQEGDGSSNQFEQFINQLKLLSDLNVKEVILEYFMYLMTQMKPDEARLALQHIPIRTRPKSVCYREKEINEVLLKAYEGLVYYVEYMRAKQSIQSLHEQSIGDPFLECSVGEMGGGDEAVMRAAAEKAAKCFSVIEGRSGVWDIFVMKQVELLEFLERPDEALKVIQSNAEKNPENPNALKQLYNYYCIHDYEVTEKKEVLQAICIMNPSDEVALELHKILCMESASIGTRIQLLFDMLDYQCWQNHTEAWGRLASDLQAAAQLCPSHMALTESPGVREAWETRSSWWPQYHFTAINPEDVKANVELFKQKLIVASLLPDIEQDFLNVVKQVLT